MGREQVSAPQVRRPVRRLRLRLFLDDGRHNGSATVWLENQCLFKEMLFHEEQMAKKYAQLVQQITDPQIQQMLKGMEQATRNHYNTLSQKMGNLGIL